MSAWPSPMGEGMGLISFMPDGEFGFQSGSRMGGARGECHFGVGEGVRAAGELFGEKSP